MLKYKADRRTLAVVSLYFLVTILGWIYFPEAWYLRISIISLLCVLSFMCAVIVHNTIHQPIFKWKFLNRVFQIFLSFTYGHSVSAYVSGHNFSHHLHAQSSMDRIRTSQMRYKWNFLNQLLLFFHVAPGIMADENGFARRMFTERPKWFAQYSVELIIVLGIKFYLLYYNWELAALLLFLPHFYAAWGIVGTNFWQHDGCDENHTYNHSRNFTGSIINFLAFNNGYHGAHHEKPHLHWSLLPKYHKEHLEPHLHPNLNLNNLFTYFWKTLIWPGKRLDYLGNPIALPELEYKDWIASADIDANAYQLGVEQ